VLGIINNVGSGGIATPSAYTSTLSLFDMSNPLTPAPIVIPRSSFPNVLSLAIDAANNVYFLLQDVDANTASFIGCPAPGYVCSRVGLSDRIVGAQWLALDAQGNAYATEITASGSGVFKFSAALGPTANNTQVYASATAPAEYYGLAVTPDGAEIYVTEGPINDFAGVNVTLHDCRLLPSCAAGGVDITQTVLTPAVTFQNLSGAVTVGTGNVLLLGLANSLGTGIGAGNTMVALSCQPGLSFTYSCSAGIAAFTAVGAGLNSWQRTAGIAADAFHHVYVAAALDLANASPLSVPPPPFPTFDGFSYGFTSGLTPFTCSITGGSPPVPQCPINQLPGPSVGPFAPDPSPYAVAVSLPN
jgi:hypothetical protein